MKNISSQTISSTTFSVCLLVFLQVKVLVQTRDDLGHTVESLEGDIAAKEKEMKRIDVLSSVKKTITSVFDKAADGIGVSDRVKALEQEVADGQARLDAVIKDSYTKAEVSRMLAEKDNVLQRYKTTADQTLNSMQKEINHLKSENRRLLTSIYDAAKILLTRFTSEAISIFEKVGLPGVLGQRIWDRVKEYEVQHAFAYNSSFDVKVFEFNCDWFKCINPLDTVQVHDIRGHVHKKIAFTSEYQTYCDEQGLYSEAGNYSTTAEAVYRYVSGNNEFVEEHTALADAIIELAILCHCVERGCDWEADYKTYRTIPRVVLKTFEVIDAEGTSHKFPYTSKTKIRGADGFRLTNKM